MPEPGMRPGGLTALAVANFVFAALWVIGGLAAIVTPAMTTMGEEAVRQQEERAAEAATRTDSRRGEKRMSPEERAAFEDVVKQVKQTPYYLFVLQGAVRGLIGVLLFVAGIGYIKLKPFLGRMIGTLAAMITMIWGVAQVAYLDKRMPEGFDLFGLVGFVYAAATLVCLHVIFKHDFGNP